MLTEMLTRARLLVAVLFLCGTGVVAGSVYLRYAAERHLRMDMKNAADAARAASAAPQVQPDITAEQVVERGANFSEALQEMDIAPADAAAITQAVHPVFNLRRLRHGNRITTVHSAEGELKSVCYHIDADHELWIARNSAGFAAEIRDVPSTTTTVTVAGELHGSLFESLMEMGEHPDLAVRLADIFAWQLDFYTDPRPGDTFAMVLEKREYKNGQAPTYGRIFAAEYNNNGHPYSAVLFHDPRGQPAYYSASGQSLQKAFLRSPLKFAARISSHYSHSRFHPILKIYRPHLGTDYAAPAGTPVQAIAEGRVIFSGVKGGGGGTVELRHSNGYATYYMHLMRRYVRDGQHVRQGQRIGLVGATGLATGPHLDFRVRRNGGFINFERMKLPPAHPVLARDMTEFTADRDRWMPLLTHPALGIQRASTPAAPTTPTPPATTPSTATPATASTRSGGS